MNAGEIRTTLKAGGRVYGTAAVSTSPVWPGMIASAGVDFVFIDTEHIPIGRETLAWMCRTYSALGVAPIVRVLEPNPYLACLALDAGAAGVVGPYLETVEQVRALRGAVKFRPLKGKRLDEALLGRALETELSQFLQRRNDASLLILNIESVPALRVLDELLSVPDVDAVWVGPHDLSINLGIPEQYCHPRFQEAVGEIIRKCRAKDVGVGIHYSEGIELEIEWVRLGANFIVHSSDMALVRQTLARDLAQFRAELDDRAAPSTAPGGDVI